MALLTGLTSDGLEVPVQVKPDGKLVAEGLTGPAGGDGPQGVAGPEGPVGPKGDEKWTGAADISYLGGKVGIGVATPAPSGGILQLAGGLSFPAAAVASANPNTLDDYEEGTWTPVVVGTTAAGTVSYSGLVGSYTKIGNTVNFLLYCGWNSGTGTGKLEVTGLPFAANVSNGRFYPGSVYANSLAIPIGDTLSALVTSTKLVLISTPTGGGVGTAVVYDGGVAELAVQGTYFIS